MIYTDEQHLWLDKRAEEIAKERGWSFHIARAEAMAEMTREDNRKRDLLIKKECTCSPVPEPNWDEGTMCTRCYDLSQIEPPEVTKIDA